jgi:hypothetical protein
MFHVRGGWVMPSPYLSRAALAAGVPARYLYWHGHSLRRYLFTCTAPDDVADFADGVVMAVSGGQIAWIGEVSGFLRLPAAARPPGASLYVHLLAATAEARRAVIEDLRPAFVSHLRLAA